MKTAEDASLELEFARSVVHGLRKMLEIQTIQESLLKDFCIRRLKQDGVKLPEKYSCGIVHYTQNHFILAICESPMWEYARTLDIKFNSIDFSYTIIKRGHAEEEE